MKKPLSREQLKFCREKLDRWYTVERDKIFTATSETAVRPTLASVVEGIRRGKFKMTKYSLERGAEPCCTGLALTSVFDIPALEGPRVKIDEKARAEAMGALEAQHDVLEAQIILGDQADALALINKL